MMKKMTMMLMSVALLSSGGLLEAQDASKMPEMPKPVKEHEWLQKFVGEWDVKGEAFMEPGKPMKFTGTESSRMLGGFWVVAEGKGEMPGMPPHTSVLTIGYSPEKKKYVGTWVDNMTSFLWNYEGTVDETGKILTFECQGQCPMKPGETVNFKEVTEFKDDNHRVFTSSMQGEDGKWTTIFTAHYTRKK